MKKFSAVLVNLQNPREKVWGILLSIQASGITVRGIDLNSFDDWSRSVSRGETEMALSTMFLPIHRVERVNQDESVGSVRSLADLDAGFREDRVPGLQISMHDASAMRFAERIRDLNPISKSLFHGKRAALESLGERLPFQILHDEEIDAVFAPNVMKRADVRVVQRRNRTRFAFQTLAELGVIREVSGENFERDDAIETGVLGFVSLAHTAGTDGLDDFVGTQARSGRDRHRENLLDRRIGFNRMH